MSTEEPSGRCLPSYTGLFLALAYHQSGDADEARTWLDKAVARRTSSATEFDHR